MPIHNTKEEETENINNIVINVIEKFINENGIVDQSQMTLGQKEELTEMLLERNVISYREIAELCNLSFYKVFEISKKLKKE